MNRHIGRLMMGLLLAAEFLYIFSVLLNYDNSWMNPEKTLTHAYFLQNGVSLGQEDFKRSMNVRVVEWGAPRITRPLSNIFEMLNAKFRAWLWLYILPHASLSLTWPFSFLLLPWLLYRFFRKMGCDTELALGGLVLYIASAGFTSPVIMLFHPGKSFVNIFAVIVLYICADIRQHADGPVTRRRAAAFVCRYAILFSAILLGFFWDETGLFIYAIALAMLLPKARSGLPMRWGVAAGFAVLPVLYLVAVREILPGVHEHLGYGQLDIAQYSSMPSLRKLILPDINLLCDNLFYLFRDHIRLRLHPFECFDAAWAAWISVFNSVCALLLVVVCVREYLRRGRGLAVFRKMGPDAAVMMVLLFSYVWFHTFQLSSNAKIWGVWWYGCLFSLLYVSFLVLVVRRISEHSWPVPRRIIILFFLPVFATDALLASTYRNNYFRIQNLTYAIPAEGMFRGESNEFQFYDFAESWRQSRIKRAYVQRVWNAARGLPGIGPGDLSRPGEAKFLDNLKGVLSVEVLLPDHKPSRMVLQPLQLHFGDFNGDGMADALYFDTTVRDRIIFSVALSNGREFGDQKRLFQSWIEGNGRLDGTGKEAEKRVHFPDINGDGKSDVVYFETFQTYRCYAGLSTGKEYRPMEEVLGWPGGSSPEQLQFAEVNGAGGADALFFEKERGIVWVALSDLAAGRKFNNPVAWGRVPSGVRPDHLAFADLNGDGRADAIRLDKSREGVIQAAFSSGSGFGEFIQWRFKPGLAPNDIRFGDIDGDGKADIAGMDRSGEGSLWIGLSGGDDFEQPILGYHFKTGNPEVFQLSDMNGDARVEAIFVEPLSFVITAVALEYGKTENAVKSNNK